MESEKRKFTRFFFRMEAEISVNGNVSRVDELRNLSVSGCLLPLSARGDIGDDCKIKIILGPDENSPVVLIEGKIIRLDKESTAVQFTRIDPESLEHLHKIAQYNATDPEKVEREIKERPGLF